MPNAEGPYRKTVPLSELIPPDRRWMRSVGLCVAGMAVGAGACHALAGYKAARADYIARGLASAASPMHIEHVTLEGPGDAVTLPMASTPVVVNVWLQGCVDCAPAFDAEIALQERGGLSVDVPIVNVAFGEATLDWANAHGVGHNLVFDPGGRNIVHPLGITTFTTLVLDEQGEVRLLDSPALPGFADRVVGATRALVRGSAKTPWLPQATDDPLHGDFTLREATAGIEGSGALVATIATSMGEIACKLYEDKAPITVANFVGLATGRRPWLDPRTHQWVQTPAYDGTTFHRVIKGFMIQGGDPKGDGTGEPGYVIRDEMWSGGTHQKAGLLCAANRGPNTNGAQFFITDTDGPPVKNLDGMKTYTIFGECTPLETVHAIASVETIVPQDLPKTPVVIQSVRIRRETLR